MGLHICIIHKETHKEHPGWDFIRQWYDSGRSYKKGFDDLIMQTDCVDICDEYGETGLFRPDTKRLRALVLEKGWEQEAKERYYHFCDLLDADDNYGVYLSY